MSSPHFPSVLLYVGKVRVLISIPHYSKSLQPPYQLAATAFTNRRAPTTHVHKTLPTAPPPQPSKNEYQSVYSSLQYNILALIVRLHGWRGTTPNTSTPKLPPHGDFQPSHYHLHSSRVHNVFITTAQPRRDRALMQATGDDVDG